jgi:hypothetical protein
LNSKRDIFWPIIFGLVTLGLGMLMVDVGGSAIQLGRFAGSLKWRLAVLALGVFLLSSLAIFAITWTKLWPRSFLAGLQARLCRLGWFNLLIVTLFYALYALLVFFPPSSILMDPLVFSGLWARLGLAILFGLASSPFLRGVFAQLGPSESAAAGVLLMGAWHQALTFVNQVSASPFSLGWSEASRFYYGSLFQSASIYGRAVPLPFLHPSRYLLLSIPFLFSGLPIWAHRLWQVLLWFGLTGLNAWLLTRRFKLKSQAIRWIGTAWAFLFIFQGPIYYHLLVCSALVLAFFDRRRFWRSLAVVVVASLWAGISRINWLPVPAFLALTIYLLETPLVSYKQLISYLAPGIIWGTAGVAAGFAANQLYIALSGQPDPSVFKSSFSQDLLWYRLWPSPTYPPGILPMALLLSLPLLVLILINIRRMDMHPLRLIGLAGMTTVLFVGGLVVSIKIGGGSNLHNLDAYFFLLLIWGSYLLSGATHPETNNKRVWRPWPLVMLILVLPLVQLLQAGSPVQFPNAKQDQAILAKIKTTVESASRNGPVLFIWQRQLLTFHEIQGVSLIPEYETVDLMEMAMANNQVYLGHFYDDLAHKRFAMIVIDQQNGLTKSPEDAFPEENNVWVERITHPILTYYRVRTNFSNGIQLLEPIQ